jgi:D-alanine-D-alanine ligase
MARILILWNQLDEDVTTLWRRDGRKTPDWDPAKVVDPGDTVEEELNLLEESVKSAGHEVIVANIKDDFDRIVHIIDTVKPDAVMNLVEFFHDDIAHEYHLASMYELLDVPYTGARPLALALCQNKPHAKAILAAQGVPTPKWMGIEVGHSLPRRLTMRFPMIVKPAYEDASGGIDAFSIVRDRAELEARIKHVHKEHRMLALVEEFIDGREVHAAFLGTPFRPLPLFEMEFKDSVDEAGKPLPHIITYRAKWDPFSRDYYAVESRCPPEDLEPEVIAHIQDVALRA